MISIDEFVYRDWRSFKADIIQELFGEDHFNRGVFIFRGQANSDWKLEPSFDRIFESLCKKDKIDAMKELLRIFKQESESLDVPLSVWDDEIKSLAL